MEVAFYAYTILIMASCIAATVSMLSLYAARRSPAYLFVAIAFLLYFFDLTFIFQSEYLSHGVLHDRNMFYAIPSPYLKAILAMGVLESVWIALCYYLNKRNIVLLVAPAAVFLTASLVVIHFLPEGSLRQWCFYSTREVFTAWILLFTLVQYRKASGPYKAGIRKLKVPVVLGVVFCILIVIENTFVILLWQPSTELMNSVAFLFISERNITENLLAFVLALFAVHFSLSASQLRSKDISLPSQDEAEKCYVDFTIDRYCEKHGLTRRERDILCCIVEGKDYQNTASELYLAIGTVKSHTHNILQKTRTKTRQELLQDFWRY
ncbi:MAG: helix-turn-helix transcriptional regulator [Gordonibacter sp.]|uniref:helix-turn-helix domain-containing protein n=1 Tax=Gordonibacter sp. TaxID=1968902 RepID=UPI002FCB8BB7